MNTGMSVMSGNQSNLSLSLLLSEMNRFLRCQDCHIVPQDHLWYIKNCFHTFCRPCLDANQDTAKCPICKEFYSHDKDLVIHRTYGNSIAGYHQLKALLSQEGDFQKEEGKDSTSLKKENCSSKKERATNPPGTTPSSNRSPKDNSNTLKEKPKANEGTSTKSNIPKVQTIPKKERKSTPKNEDLLNRSLIFNTTPSRSRNSMNKRNVKGETPLHVASCKGDYMKVVQLLDMGADPNNQDNAGWTPLHECAQKGYVDIAQILLEKGAAPSVPGGPDNVTPLHDAAAQGCKDIVSMLIKKGANKSAMDSKGRTPRFYAFSIEIVELIDTTVSEVTESQVLRQSVPLESAHDTILIYFESSKDINAETRNLIKNLDLKLQNQFIEEVTHVIFSSSVKSENGDYLLNNQNYLYLETILSSKKALALDWVTKCIEERTSVDTANFIIKGTLDFPKFPLSKVALNNAKRLPRLFDGMHFNIHNSVSDKKELANMIKRGSGIILKREPDPECIPEHEKKIPYHADPNGPLKSCSHYIIYQSGSKREPELKYDMSHIKTLSTEWIYNCIRNFSIVPP